MDITRFLNPVKGREAELVDLYSEFYGEKFKGKIESNLQNTVFLFIDKDSSIIEKVESRVAGQYLDECYSKLGISIGMEPDAYDLYHLKSVLENSNYSSYIDCYKLSALAHSLGFNVDNIKEWLSVPTHYIMVLSKINEGISLWEKEYEPKVSEVTSRSQKQAKTRETIMGLYTEKLNNLYLSKMQDIANHYGVELDSSFLSTFRSIIAYGRDGLDDIFISKGRKQAIVDYFSSLGVSNKSYGEFLSDDTLMDIIFDKDFVGQVNQLNKEYDVNMVLSSPQFQDAKNVIDGLDLVNGDYDILASIYEYIESVNSGNETAGFVSHEMCKDGSVKHICVLPTAMGLDDDTFLHEVGHIVHYVLLHTLGNTAHIKNGLENMQATIYPTPDTFSMQKLISRNGGRSKYAKQNVRQYTYINEVIHEYLVQKLCKLAQSKGMVFGMRPAIYESVYSRAFPAIERIVDAHLDKFKECFMSDDPKALENFLGADLLDKLSDAVEFMMTIDPIDKENISTEIASNVPVSQLSDKTRWYLDFIKDALDVEYSLSKK